MALRAADQPLPLSHLNGLVNSRTVKPLVSSASLFRYHFTRSLLSERITRISLLVFHYFRHHTDFKKQFQDCPGFSLRCTTFLLYIIIMQEVCTSSVERCVVQHMFRRLVFHNLFLEQLQLTFNIMARFWLGSLEW